MTFSIFFQIRTNSINPGFVVGTQMHQNFVQSFPEQIGIITEGLPLRKFAGKSQCFLLCCSVDFFVLSALFSDFGNCIDAVLFLLSDKAAHINGVNLAVDGGQVTPK